MHVTTGIPDAHRSQVAALYWDAFGGKLGRIMGPKTRALALIERVLRLDHAICACDNDGRLLGVVGFKTHQGALVEGHFADLCRVYGWVGGMVRAALMAALIRDTDNDRFLIDGIFVAPEARGRGIGTALLTAIAAEAKTRGYHQVRLDVINTNPRARALYLQQGFVDLHSRKTGLWRHILGFDATITMVRDV